MTNDAGKVCHDHFLGDDDPARETRAAGRVLQVGDIFGARDLQRQIGFRKGVEIAGLPDMLQIQPGNGFREEREKGALTHGRLSAAGVNEFAQVVDIGLTAAKMHCSRKRYGHETGILTGKEKTDEVRIGVGNEGYAPSFRQAEPQEFAGKRAGHAAQQRIGNGSGKVSLSRIKV